MTNSLSNFLKKENYDLNSYAVVFKFSDYVDFLKREEFPKLEDSDIIITAVDSIIELFEKDYKMFITTINNNFIEIYELFVHNQFMLSHNKKLQKVIFEALFFVSNKILLSNNNQIKVKTKYSGIVIGKNGKNIKKFNRYLNRVLKEKIKLQVIS